MSVDITIVMPCLNEAETLEGCINSAKGALKQIKEKFGLDGEIVISDNGSSDGSQKIAKNKGCRVVKCPEKGYGNALNYGILAAKGKYVVMGDSDGSHDFNDCIALVEKVIKGDDLCIGNRLVNKTANNAFSWKNRYIGIPVLTGILNLFYKAGISDAHCGLRAFTKKAFLKMDLCAGGMEFASEMLVKASLQNLKISENAITMHPSGRSRQPHLRPWRDGWRHLKFLLLLSPLWLFFVPGAILFLGAITVFSLLITLPADQLFSSGRIVIGDHWMILAGGLWVGGIQLFIFGIVATVYSMRSGLRRQTKLTFLFQKCTKLEVILGIGLLFFAFGLTIFVYVIMAIFSSGAEIYKYREMVVATSFMVSGVQLSFGAFVVSLIRENWMSRRVIELARRQWPEYNKE